MVVGKQALLAVRGTEVMADSKSATTGPPAEVVASAKEDSEGRASGSPHQQDDTGNAAPASQFRITSVAQVEGEETPSDPLDTSVNEGLRASMCLSDTNSVDTEQTDGNPDPQTPTANPRPPSPAEEVLQGPAPQNHQSLRLNGSHLTTQQSQLPGSSRFRKVAKYLRERWQVEDSVETDRAEEGKSSSTVLLTQGPVLVPASQSGPLVESNSLASSSSPNLSAAGSEKWENVPAIESQEMASEKGAESRPQSKLATHEVKVPVQLSPPQSVDQGGEVAQPESIFTKMQLHSSHSSDSFDVADSTGSGIEERYGFSEEFRQHEEVLKSASSSVGTRTPVTEEGTGLSLMQGHMDEVGDVLTKLQRLYGAISSEHVNLGKQLRAAQFEVATLKEKQRALKKENEAVTKENTQLKSRLEKLENESKHNKPSRTAQNDHKEPTGDPL